MGNASQLGIRGRNWGFPTAVSACGAIFAILLARWTLVSGAPLLICAVVLACGLASIYLWLSHVRQNGFDLLDPANAVGAVLVVGFWSNWLLAAVHRATSPSSKTLCIVALATVAFFGAYRSRVAKPVWRCLPLPRFLARPMGRAASRRLFALWACTAAFRVAFSYRGGFGSALTARTTTGPLDNFIQLIGFLGPYLLYMDVVLLSDDPRGHSRALWVLVIGGVFAEAGLAALAGWKSGPLVIAVAVLLYMRVRGKNSRASVTLGVTALVVSLPICVVSFGAISNYRMQARGQSVSPWALGQLLASYTSAQAPNAARALSQRVAYGQMLDTLVSAVDRRVVPYQRGATLWPALVTFVPRALWPGKPTISVGGWYARTVLGWDPDSRSEAAVTLLGDFYLNFGVAGVVAGMMLYGFAMRAAYEHLIRRVGTTAAIWAFLPIFVVGTLGLEKNFASIVAQTLQLLVSVVAVTFVVQQSGHGGRLVVPSDVLLQGTKR